MLGPYFQCSSVQQHPIHPTKGNSSSTIFPAPPKTQTKVVQEAASTDQHCQDEGLRGVVRQHLRVQQHIVLIGHWAPAAPRGCQWCLRCLHLLCAGCGHGAAPCLGPGLAVGVPKGGHGGGDGGGGGGGGGGGHGGLAVGIGWWVKTVPDLGARHLEQVRLLVGGMVGWLVGWLVGGWAKRQAGGTSEPGRQRPHVENTHAHSSSAQTERERQCMVVGVEKN